MNRPVLLWSGVGAIALAIVLGLVLAAGGTNAPAIDVTWNAFMADTRTPVLIEIASVLDHIGGGWIATYLIPLAVIGALLLLRRWRSAVFVAAALLFSVVAVQLLKTLFARTRPEDMLIVSDFGSFPSGHTANAATLATLAVLLFPRIWVLIVAVGWTVLMALSRTLVSVHWLTDTVGGMLVGAGATLVLGGFMLTWARSRGVESGMENRP